MEAERNTIKSVSIPNNVEPPYERRCRFAVQVAMVLAASISYFVMGMTLSWPNVIQSHLPIDNSTLFGNQLYLHNWQMDMLKVASFRKDSLVSIGSAFGLFFGGWIVRKVGRQKSLILAVVPGLIGWTILGLAYNTYMLLIGRFCDGITSGMVTLTVMAYATEISDTNFRGTINTLPTMMFLFGAAFCVGIGITLTWYHLALANACLLLVYIFIVPFLPESPLYLIIINQEEKAAKVLERLRGTYIDIGNEIKSIKKINDEVTGDTKYSFLLNRDVQKRILVLTILFLVQGFSGTAVLRANAVRILEDSGVTFNKDMFATLMLLLPIGGTFVLLSLVDRLGRRICLVISLTLMMVFYVLLGTHVYFRDHTIVSIVPLELNDTAQPPSYYTEEGVENDWWVTVAVLNMCIFAMNIGIESLPWQLSSEYFPATIRSQAMSVSILIGCVIAASALQLYSYMNAIFTTSGLFWTYAAVSGIGVVFSALFVPETARTMVG